MINYSQAAGLLYGIGVAGEISLHLVKQENDVYRINSGEQTFFLKLYTKSWYGDDAAGTAFHVRHERAAQAILKVHGLNVPEVMAADTTITNQVGRPFIITRELAGKPLVDGLMLAEDGEFDALLRAVGGYLRQMHNITFENVGYLDTADGPSTPPDADGWQHRCWSADQRQKNALVHLETIRPLIEASLASRLENHLLTMADRLKMDYQPPRFTHGDCHAHQFFLELVDGEWQVTGVVDMEVSSAGDCGEDWLKLGLELAMHFAPDSCWWESLFKGYGAEPDFERLRLRLLGVEPVEFGLSGVNQKLLADLLDANDWTSLFSAIYEVS
jgi:aminoglycoside phosphotransferase (APT) family kinase protein